MRARLYLNIAALAATLATAPQVHAKERAPELPSALAGKAATLEAFPRWINAPAEPPETKREDPIVVRLQETQVRLDKQVSQFFNRAIQVNERSALSSIGQFALEYNPEYQKVRLHRIALLRDGKLLDRSKDANMRRLQREPGIESGTFVGTETVQLLLRDVRVGDTLWISYSIEGSNPVFGNTWNGIYSWDGGSPIEMRRLVLQHPVQRKVAWRQLGDFNKTEVTPQMEERNGWHIMRFEGRGLDAIEREARVPANYLPARLLEFSEYRDWRHVADWAQTLFPANRPGPGLTRLVRQLSNEPDPAKRAAAALHWVQNEVRYFSVSIGENSHRPRTPEQVLQLRYGDCKDKSYLLASLLNALGIEAYPMLISAQDPKLPGRALPGTRWFDHAVVGVTLEGQTYYVDPTLTGQVSPIAQLSPLLPGATALPVKAGSSELVTMPARELPMPAYEQTDFVKVLNLEGDATLELRQVYRGRLAESMRVRLDGMSKRETARELLAMYEKRYRSIELAGDPAVTDDAASNELRLVARFKVSTTLRNDKGSYSWPFSTQVLGGAMPLPDKLVRNFPFAIPSETRWSRFRTLLTWPAQVRAEDVFSAQAVDNKFFRINEEHVLRGGQVDYMLDYRVKKEIANPAEMVELNTETRKMESFVAGTFLVADWRVRPESVANIPLRMIEASSTVEELRPYFADHKQREKPMEAQDECDRLLAGLRLSSLAPGFAWKSFHALKQRVIDAKASDSDRECQARLQFVDGEFAEVMRTLKGLPREFGESEAARIGAWSLLYNGERASAVERMEGHVAAQFGSNGPRKNVLLQADRLALHQRASMPAPESLLAYAREYPAGPWPRPILAMQVGLMTPEALLEQVAAMPHDVASIATPQAWLYIGHKFAGEGKLEEAFNAFRQAGSLAYRSENMLDDARAALYFLDPNANTKDAQRKRAFALLSGKGVKQDIAEAVKLFKSLADQGDVAAQFSYALQKRDENDHPAYLEWLERAAGQGYGPAQAQLGLEMANKEEPDEAAANKWLTLGALQGDADAQMQLGYRFMEGVGGIQDRPAGTFWSSLAARQNNPTAMLNLGVAYEFGYGVVASAETAIKLYQAAAEMGNKTGLSNIGSMYFNGHGVPKDEAKGVEMFRKAAASKERKGIRLLGWAYDAGRGVRRDTAEAHRLYLMAAELGDLQAQYNAGYNFRYGEGVAADFSQSLKWYRLAAARGSHQACQGLGLAYKTGAGVKRDYIEALKWFQRASELGNDIAPNNVGLAYEYGNGVETDLAKAREWYEVAAKRGNVDSQANLARLLARGHGGPPDRVRAYKLWQGVVVNQAADAGTVRDARNGLKEVEPEMTPSELSQAKGG